MAGEVDSDVNSVNSRKWEMEKKLSVNGSMNNSNSNNLYNKLSNNINRTITQPTNTFKPLSTIKQQSNFMSGFYNE